MDEFPLYDLNDERICKIGKYWVAIENADPALTAGYPQKAQIHDVTLRDGEQTPGVTFLEDERVRIAQALDELGVSRIEAGMPAVSATQFNALKRISSMGLDAMTTGFCRANPKDIGLALDAGCKGLIVEHAMNPYYNKYAYKLTPAQLIDRLVTSLSAAKEEGVFTVFMGWDWFRAPMAYTKWVVSEVYRQIKFDSLCMVDTMGSALPEAVGFMFSQFHKWFPALQLEFHGHNDSSLGVACSLSALKNGAAVIHSSMNGLGGRAGNVATEEIANAAQTLLGIDCGIDLEKVYPTATLISKIAKVPIPPSKCLIGTRPYEIETGIMTHVVKTFGPMGIDPIQTSYNPSMFGIPGGFDFVLGKNSGTASVQMFMERYNISLDKEETACLLERIKAEAMVTKALVSDTQVLAMCADIKAGK